NEVYKETSKLFDWGFKSAGKVEPVGTLVRPGPKGLESGSGSDGAGGSGKKTGDHAQAAVSPGDDGSGSGGVWTAVGVTGGSLVLLGGVAYAVHRRWPLPELVRRRSRG
ncbi:D-alanyl-D-alanine carboxypeptidase, partial [Streptomyces sp. 2MCAF27]